MDSVKLHEISQDDWQKNGLLQACLSGSKENCDYLQKFQKSTKLEQNIKNSTNTIDKNFEYDLTIYSDFEY